MATLLQEEYYDTLEYVCNVQQLGGDIKMAEYQARNIAITFINFYTTL